MKEQRPIASCAQLDNPEVPWFPAVILQLSEDFRASELQASRVKGIIDGNVSDTGFILSSMIVVD